jgi:hypothetical protein
MTLSALDTFVCPFSKERLSLVAFEEDRLETSSRAWNSTGRPDSWTRRA